MRSGNGMVPVALAPRSSSSPDARSQVCQRSHPQWSAPSLLEQQESRLRSMDGRICSPPRVGRSHPDADNDAASLPEPIGPRLGKVERSSERASEVFQPWLTGLTPDCPTTAQKPRNRELPATCRVRGRSPITSPRATPSSDLEETIYWATSARRAEFHVLSRACSSRA